MPANGKTKSTSQDGTSGGAAATGRGAPRGAARLRAGLSQTVAAAADLLEEGDRAHAGIPEDARDLLVDEVAPDPRQPRRHFEEADLTALAEDIARRGVLQPILVRPPEAPGEPYRIVAGERRWRAAQRAGKVRIPARVRAMTEEEVRAAQLAENVLRADLSDIEKGRALRALYELRKAQNYRATWEDVAAEVGLGRARIHDLYHLASLPDRVAALIGSGRLSGSHGVALQRAQQFLSEDEVVALAERAARPAGRRRGAGGFALSVARLRREILARTHPEEAAAAEAEAQAEAARRKPALRPFLRRTVEALRENDLTPAEREALREALRQAEQAEQAELAELAEQSASGGAEVPGAEATP